MFTSRFANAIMIKGLKRRVFRDGMIKMANGKRDDT